MCPIPNSFRDRAISLYSTLYRRATRHVLTSWKVHWCWRWNFRKCIILGKLYQLSLEQYIPVLETVRDNSFLPTILKLYSEIAVSRKRLGIGHMYIYNFCLEWPILWPPRILTFPYWDTLYHTRNSIINIRYYYSDTRGEGSAILCHPFQNLFFNSAKKSTWRPHVSCMYFLLFNYIPI
jgi:hypothetical protein